MDTALSRYEEPLNLLHGPPRPTSIAFIHYMQTTYGRLSRMLAKHSIKSVSLQPRKIYGYLPPVEDA
jgi:hypothetical protein